MITVCTFSQCEIECRRSYLDMMSEGMEVLRPLAEACFNNDPSKRPKIEEVLSNVRK